jgi:hypothetical protein
MDETATERGACHIVGPALIQNNPIVVLLLTVFHHTTWGDEMKSKLHVPTC